MIKIVDRCYRDYRLVIKNSDGYGLHYRLLIVKITVVADDRSGRDTAISKKVAPVIRDA